MGAYERACNIHACFTKSIVSKVEGKCVRACKEREKFFSDLESHEPSFPATKHTHEEVAEFQALKKHMSMRKKSFRDMSRLTHLHTPVDRLLRDAS